MQVFLVYIESLFRASSRHKGSRVLYVQRDETTIKLKRSIASAFVRAKHFCTKIRIPTRRRVCVVHKLIKVLRFVGKPKQSFNLDTDLV